MINIRAIIVNMASLIADCRILLLIIEYNFRYWALHICIFFEQISL